MRTGKSIFDTDVNPKRVNLERPRNLPMQPPKSDARCVDLSALTEAASSEQGYTIEIGCTKGCDWHVKIYDIQSWHDRHRLTYGQAIEYLRELGPKTPKPPEPADLEKSTSAEVVDFRRLVEDVVERGGTVLVICGADSRDWSIRLHDGLAWRDCYRITYEQVIVHIRNLGVPQPVEPSIFQEWIKKASDVLGCPVTVSCGSEGWSVSVWEDDECGGMTYEDAFSCVHRLILNATAMSSGE